MGMRQSYHEYLDEFAALDLSDDNMPVKKKSALVTVQL